MSAAVVSAAGGTASGQQALRTGRFRAACASPRFPAPQRLRPAPPASWPGSSPSANVKDVSVLSADALGNRQPAAAGVMSYTATDGDLQGSAAAACQAPSNDLWLDRGQHGGGPQQRPEPDQRLNHACHGQPRALRQERPDQGPRQPRTAGWPGNRRAPSSWRVLPPAEERLSVHARSTGRPRERLHPAERAARTDPRRRRLHRPGNGTLGPRQVMTGIDIQDAGGRGSSHRRDPASATPHHPCRSPFPDPSTPWWRSSSSAAAGRRHCQAAVSSQPRPAP